MRGEKHVVCLNCRADEEAGKGEDRETKTFREILVGECL